MTPCRIEHTASVWCADCMPSDDEIMRIARATRVDVSESKVCVCGYRYMAYLARCPKCTDTRTLKVEGALLGSHVKGLFPEDSAERKTWPVFSGALQYFPSAIAAVSHHSYLGNQKHNPGQELHHDRAKSGDEADALVRHLMEGDLVGMAWRALSMLQKDLEAKGAPIAPAARNAQPHLSDLLRQRDVGGIRLSVSQEDEE